jgi:glycosyltransferase involved in cell wall biosynthesis
MINILHLRDTDRVCGPGKTIIETACAAFNTEFRHTIGLFVLERERTNLYADAARARHVDVVPLRSRHQFDPRIVRAVIGAIEAHGIHLLHSHEYKSDLIAWAVARLLPIPVVSTVHGYIRNSMRAKAYIRLSQHALRSFSRVIAVSEETRAAVVGSGVPAAQVRVVHNGIVTDNYRPDRTPKGTFRAAYRLSPDQTLVGYIGRLSPEKGQRDFLRAAAELARRRSNLRFAMVGDGPDRALLEREASALGIGDRVVFTGHLTDVRPVFRDIDVLALTSHTEGFPNVVLEAFCMDTPVLATRVGGVPEILHDGETGVLIEPHAPSQITAGLSKLLDDPVWAQGLAAAGKRLVLDQFTFEQRVRKEHTVCREVLDTWRR